MTDLPDDCKDIKDYFLTRVRVKGSEDQYSFSFSVVVSTLPNLSFIAQTYMALMRENLGRTVN